MARGVNKVILIGNLGDEPLCRSTHSGCSVTNISMVTNEVRRNIDTGETTEYAEWHRVVMWGKLADIAKQYLHKGSQIYVEGKLRTRSFLDKQGQKRSVTEIVADEMQMLGSRQGPGNSMGNGMPNNRRQNQMGGFNNQNMGNSIYGNEQPTLSQPQNNFNSMNNMGMSPMGGMNSMNSMQGMGSMGSYGQDNLSNIYGSMGNNDMPSDLDDREMMDGSHNSMMAENRNVQAPVISGGVNENKVDKQPSLDVDEIPF